MSRNSDKYYKTQEFIFKNDKDKRYANITSEYGFNLDSNSRRIIDKEELEIRPSINTNKDYLKGIR